MRQSIRRWINDCNNNDDNKNDLEQWAEALETSTERLQELQQEQAERLRRIRLREALGISTERLEELQQEQAERFRRIRLRERIRRYCTIFLLFAIWVILWLISIFLFFPYL